VVNPVVLGTVRDVGSGVIKRGYVYDGALNADSTMYADSTVLDTPFSGAQILVTHSFNHVGVFVSVNSVFEILDYIDSDIQSTDYLKRVRIDRVTQLARIGTTLLQIR
jgi:hypothetical protein